MLELAKSNPQRWQEYFTDLECLDALVRANHFKSARFLLKEQIEEATGESNSETAKLAKKQLS